MKINLHHMSTFILPSNLGLNPQIKEILEEQNARSITKPPNAHHTLIPHPASTLVQKTPPTRTRSPFLPVLLTAPSIRLADHLHLHHLITQSHHTNLTPSHHFPRFIYLFYFSPYRYSGKKKEIPDLAMLVRKSHRRLNPAAARHG